MVRSCRRLDQRGCRRWYRGANGTKLNRTDSRGRIEFDGMVTRGGERPFGLGAAGTELRADRGAWPSIGSCTLIPAVHPSPWHPSPWHPSPWIVCAMPLRPRGACRARVVAVGPPSDHEGAGNAGCWPQPMARLRTKCRRQEPQVQPDNRHSLRDGSTSYAHSPRGSAVLPP